MLHSKSDYYTHCWDLPPQLGGCVAEEAGAKYRQAINGEDGSWELPLKPHNGGVEPDWNAFLGQDEAAAKREAVERVSANHDAIASFAARGAGRKGMPPVMAPLADPNATPNEAVLGTVDAVLRTVCVALLENGNDDDAQPDATKLQRIAQLISTTLEQGSSSSDDFLNGVLDSLVYLRDRVGVPRDMRLPAARQLRAHLNWAIANLDTAATT